MSEGKNKSQGQPLVPSVVPQVDEATQRYLDKQAEEIRAIGGQAVWAIGKRVLAVRNRLRKFFGTTDEQPPGFVEWCRDNFAWSVTQAYRLLRIAEQFPTKPPPALIAKTASYYLTSPSAPQEALDEAVARAMAGKEIGVAEAREIIARHTPTIFGPPATAPVAPPMDQQEFLAPVPPGDGEEEAEDQEAEVEPEEAGEPAEGQEAGGELDQEPEGEAGGEGAGKPPRRLSHSYDASNGYRVAVWGEKGKALDPAQVKIALLEAAERVVSPEHQ